MRIAFRKSIQWNVGGKTFEFVTDDVTGEFRTPDGQTVTLLMDEWRALTTGLSEIAHISEPRKKGDPVVGAPNNGQPWTAELDATVTSRWTKGADVAQIAEELGRTAGSISSRLMHLGLVADRYEATQRRRSALT